MAAEFLDGLVASGTTSALVFGSHFAPAMDELFTAAAQRGLNITSGLVLSATGYCVPDLLNSPETALADSADLILRWHDRGRLRYAVTPRFSLSASDEMLDACAQLLGKGVWFTSHINENLAEIATVAGLFPGARHYLDTYARHGLVTARSVFAHNVHPGDAELTVLAEHGASVAHCPTSNSALGSGLFPLRLHIRARHRRRARLGRGRGDGPVPAQEVLQDLLHPAASPRPRRASPAAAVHLRHPADPGRSALGLDNRVGDFAVGKDFDVVWLRPAYLQHAGGQPAARPRAPTHGAGPDVHPATSARRGRRLDQGERAAGQEPSLREAAR